MTFLFHPAGFVRNKFFTDLPIRILTTDAAEAT